MNLMSLVNEKAFFDRHSISIEKYHGPAFNRSKKKFYDATQERVVISEDGSYVTKKITSTNFAVWKRKNSVFDQYTFNRFLSLCKKQIAKEKERGTLVGWPNDEQARLQRIRAADEFYRRYGVSTSIAPWVSFVNGSEIRAVQPITRVGRGQGARFL